MDTAYLVRLSTLIAAFGAGAGGALAIQGAVARAAIPQPFNNVDNDFDVPSGFDSQVSTVALNRVCPRFNAKFTLTGSDMCTATDVKRFCLDQVSPGDWFITGPTFERQNATVTLGPPQ